MSDVSRLVDQIDGVREGVAGELATRYDSVSALAAAREEDLQEVKGVGPVLATRILDTARDEAPSTTRPVLDVVEDAAGDASSGESVDIDADIDLPPVVVRVATWVGTTIGWTIRACRTVTTPITRLLHRA